MEVDQDRIAKAISVLIRALGRITVSHFPVLVPFFSGFVQLFHYIILHHPASSYLPQKPFVLSFWYVWQQISNLHSFLN